MDLGIEGRVALVAASTSGLGRASAEALAAEGANVVVTGRRGDVIREVVGVINARDAGRAVGAEVNLLHPDGRIRAVERTREEFGDPDILVLNGPGPRPATALDVVPEDAECAVNRLVVPHIHLVSLVLDAMRKQRWGRIIAVGSSSVDVGIPTLALSTMGRSALAGWLKLLSAQVADEGVTVNLVLPGRIVTQRIEQLDTATAEAAGVSVDEVRARTLEGIPAGRLGTPAEFGAAVAFLASEQSAYTTGTALRLDGGATPVL